MPSFSLLLVLLLAFFWLPLPPVCAEAPAAGTAINSELPRTDYHVEVSISRCTLTLFAREENGSLSPLKEYRAGTAVRGLAPLPLGRGRVTRIELNPSWHPTPYSREIYRRKGIILPAVVPPGHPLNYMGAVKISLSHRTSRGSIYRIHGNNNPARVGKRVTGGCVCLDNADALELARTISVGTEVDIVP